MTTTEMPDAVVPSFRAGCDTCGTEVWVSELTGRPLLDAGDRVICVACFGKIEGPVLFEDAGQIAEADAWVLEHEGPDAPGVPSSVEVAAILGHNRATQGDPEMTRRHAVHPCARDDHALRGRASSWRRD